MGISLYTTQGGGVCRYNSVSKQFYWTEVPGWCPEMNVGDTVPEEWGVRSINQEASAEMENLR